MIVALPGLLSYFLCFHNDYMNAEIICLFIVLQRIFLIKGF